MSEANAFLEAVSGTRASLEKMVDLIKHLKAFPGGFVGASDPGEIIANIMLSLRHVEDAKMRLGKAVQAYQGGRSVYDEAPKENV